jgi:hypothetical protein
MKTFLKVVGCILGVVGVIGAIYFGYQYNKVNGEKEVLVQQNAQLQSNIDAIGPVTTAYTVASEVESGDVIGIEDFIPITIPVSAVTDVTLLDLDQAVGKLYKINIQPGTTITSDMIMTSEFSETIYEKDMVFDYLPLGLKIGDYVDVKIALPFGETFIVMQHKRIEQVVTDSCIVKMYLTPAEQALWESASRDKALYKDCGLSLYIDKYVEPGVQNSTMASYPVREEMAAVVMVDRNITDKKACVNSTLRASIDAMLELAGDTEKSKLSSSVTTNASSIKNAATNYTENKSNSSNVVITGDDDNSNNSSETSVDLSSYDTSETLEEINDNMSNLEDEAAVTLN